MSREVKILGVPLHYGANRCGIEYGLSTFFDKYPEYSEKIKVVEVELQKEDFTRKSLKFLNTIRKTCDDLAEEVNKVVKEGGIPLVMGGDHAIALGSIAGVSKEKEIGVIWVDAHGDFNTGETTESGHIHGMPLGASLGYGDEALTNCYYSGKKLKEENVVLFAIRDLDANEEKLINEAGIRCYTFDDIAKRGFDVCLREAGEYLAGKEVHISFDLDSVDPSEITGVSTPVKGGISKKEGMELFDYFLKEHTVSSVDIVEYNPIYEKEADTVDYLKRLMDKIINS